jgi:hypothetical protein
MSLSSPAYVPRPPRPLTAAELATALRVAAVLVPGTAGMDDYPALLDLALAARRDAFAGVVAELARLEGLDADALPAALRRACDAGDPVFGVLSSVIAGAYLLAPAVRERIGYPGQAARPPRFDLAAEQITDGILDPVIERGPIFRDPSRP